jgi:hypothetical protein
MRRRLLFVVGICAFTGSLHAAQFTQAEPQLAPPKPGTATIVGQVVDAVSGDPIPGAVVSATFASVADGAGAAPAPPTQRRVVASANGRFVLTRVASGPLMISASASGYMNAGYGQRTPTSDSRALVIADGQATDPLTVRLWKPAVVEGRLVDEAGEPLVRVAIRALRRGWANAKPTFGGNNSTTTDDRGVFRLADLIPGDWVLVMAASYQTTPESVRAEYRRLRGLGGSAAQEITRAMSASGAPSAQLAGDRIGAFVVQYPTGLEGLRPTDDGGWLGYGPAYFPAISPDGLEVIRLAAGEVRTGIEMRAQPSRVVSVSGRVLGPDGPVSMVGVRLKPVVLAGAFPDEIFETARAATDINGAFTFIGVSAGEYDLRVERIPRPDLGAVTSVISGPNGSIVTSLGAPTVSAEPPAEPTLTAVQRISVGNRDLNGISVSLGVGPRVSGKVEFSGTATLPTPDQIQRVGVTLRPLDRLTVSGTTAARFDAQGRFLSGGFPPGRYVVQAASPGGGWLMQSAMLGGKDVSLEPLVLESTDVAGIVVTYSDRRTELSGSVLPAEGADTDAVLVAFPSDVRAWIRNGVNSRQVRFTRSDSEGRYLLAALPAGSYLVAALPSETTITLDPEFFEGIARLATTVTLAEGEKRALDLRINRARDEQDVHEADGDRQRVSGPFVPEDEPQQAPARDVVAIAIGTGSISGIVTLDDEARTPVRRARVQLTGSAGTVTLMTATDDQGRFTFKDLPPVRYNLSAQRAGLVNAAYGSTKPGDMRSRPLALADGQQLTGVALTMGRGAVITGRVSDEFGRPAERAELTLLQSRIVNGAATWTEAVGTFVGQNLTDDRGVYRIYGLPSGEYLVGVIGRSSGTELRRVTDAELQWAERRSNEPPPPQGPIVGSAPFYYPGTADPTAATPVRVNAGEERTGIDVVVRYVRNSRVSGRIEMPDGSTPRTVQLNLYSSERITSLGASFFPRVNPDGTFATAPVPPGKYTLIARAAPNAGPAPPQGAPAGGRGGAPVMSLWFMQDIVLAGDDVNGVVITLVPGLTVSGRVTFDATTAAVPADPRALSVRLVQVSTGAVTLGLPVGQLNPDGTFVVEGVVPGSYRVSVGMPVRTGSLPTWTVRHVMHEGRDVADFPLEVRPGSDVSGLEAVLTDRVTEVSGTVTDQQGKPSTDYSVIILPVDKSLWSVGLRRRPASQRPDTTGRFRMIDLAAGDYYLALVADIQPDQVNDTTFLESLIPSAVKFTLKEGERKVQDVKLAGGGHQ